MAVVLNLKLKLEAKSVVDQADRKIINVRYWAYGGQCQRQNPLWSGVCRAAP